MAERGAADAVPGATELPEAPAAGRGLLDQPLHARSALLVLALLAALPPVAQALDGGFYVSFASRILIFALAATSLNLLIGFGGMVSFGHAAFVGIGAYAVGILMQQGVDSALVAWPAAMLVAGLFALAIGAVSVRTHGVYFIMITLAFAQMLYYLVVSLRTLGGDDGLPLAGRSRLPFGLDAGDDATFYYAVLVVCALAFVFVQRLLNARFGFALRAIAENESRMQAIGFPVLRYRLVAFTIAGALAGLAGALLANQTGLVTPSTLQWTQSGALMVMVILGGVGHLWGGAIGAAVLLLVEEFAAAWTIHWQLGVGAVLLAVVLASPDGIAGLIARWRRR
jgi:branched-chain amino acid transport system permease protein